MRLTLILTAALLASCNRVPELKSLGQIPDFELTSQTGQKVSLNDLKGRVWVADTIFTNCQGPCPMMTSRMRGVAKEVASLTNVRMVSLSVDPERDTPDALLAYSKNFQANPAQWLFLTGQAETLNHVTDQGLHLTKVDGSLEHGTKFALVDQKSEVRGYYRPFDREELQKLVSDIRYLAGR